MTMSVVVILVIASLIIGGIIGHMYTGSSNTTNNNNTASVYSPNMAKLSHIADVLTQYSKLRGQTIPPLEVVNITPAIMFGLKSGNQTIYFYTSNEYKMVGVEQIPDINILEKAIADAIKNGNSNTTAAKKTNYPNMVNDLSNTTLYPSLGPKNATYTVVEFSDYRCSACGLAEGLANWTKQYADNPMRGEAKNIQDLAQNGKIRFIYVPLTIIGGQKSVYASEAALCAHEQGKFWEMHDLLFSVNTANEDPTAYTKTNIEKLANGVDGLNMTTFTDCLDNDKTLSQVKTVGSTVSKFGIAHTPTFYINGQETSDPLSQISAVLGK